jgi:hypothetical protein
LRREHIDMGTQIADTKNFDLRQINRVPTIKLEPGCRRDAKVVTQQNAMRWREAVDVRYGSYILQLNRYVRFTSESGHSTRECPKCPKRILPVNLHVK